MKKLLRYLEEVKNYCEQKKQTEGGLRRPLGLTRVNGFFVRAHVAIPVELRGHACLAVV